MPPIQDLTAIFIAIGTIVTALITFGIAISTRATLREAKKNSYADTLFRLDEAFLRYDDVRVKLTVGGVWHRKVGDQNFPEGPDYDRAEDFSAITSYMGLFERIWKLIERQIITIDEFDAWYGDRFMHIVMNSKIKARLDNPIHKKGWSGFIDLGKDLVKQRKQFSHRWVPEEALLPDELKSN